MDKESFGQGLATPIMRQEEAFTSALERLHDSGVPEMALKRAGSLGIGESLSGETSDNTWSLIRNREAEYRVIVKDKK